MIKLNKSIRAWNTPTFADVLVKEISLLNAEQLPLQQGLSHSSYAIADNLSVTILNVQDDSNYIMVKAGLFYTGIIAGCNCADDPTPVNENNEYCDVLLKINKITADTTVSIID